MSPVSATRSAGERDLLVSIEAATPGQGPSGFPVQAWDPLPPAEWMARTHVRSDERWAADQTSAYRLFVWQMRYRADMDPDLVNVTRDRRLAYSGKTYDIRSATLVARQAIDLTTLSQD